MIGAADDVISLWQVQVPPQPPRPSLNGREEAEVVIVGAGISGLSLAVQLAASGVAPIVLEAASPGSGALGASAGIIAPQLVRDTPMDMLTKLGSDLGAGWLQLIGESGRFLFQFIAEHEIACQAQNKGFIAPSAHPDAYKRLQSLCDEWRPFRQDMEVLGADTVAQLTGCKGYQAAILDHSGGGLNPLMLAYGLATRAERLGARIFDNSRVTDLRPVAGKWQVTTRSGTILASRVVLCANGGNAELHPGLRQTVLPMHIYEMATKPVTAAMRADVLPQSHVMTDMELDIFSLRYAEDDRLVTAYPVKQRQSLMEVQAQVNKRLSRILRFPHKIEIDYLWHGMAWINSSLMPRIVDVEDGVIAVQACNGRGIATNAILGREVARMILSDERYRSRLSGSLPKPVSNFWLAGRLPNMIMSYGHALRALRSKWARND